MKKLKVTETATGVDGTLDKINSLPESLLLQILSLLPWKDAVKTCLVSKRWQYLWTSIHNLTLVCKYSCKSDREKFVSFVDYAFAQLHSSKIKKFHLELKKMPHYSLLIEQWLSYAIKNKVEHVLLNSFDCGAYTLPQFLCTCSSLITLHLSHCVFDKGVVISWKSLKKLVFFVVYFNDEEMVKLLSGCPALETMELSCFHSFHRLEINNSSLKRLTLKEFWPADEGGHLSMEIVAPYIQHLEISGAIEDVKFRLVNVSSLVSADLTFCIILGADSCAEYHHVIRLLVQNYLQKLSHVMELTVATWFAEALHQGVFMLRLDGVQLPELKCKCLTLKMEITMYNLYGVASILQASPHVETLSMDVEDRGEYLRCRDESCYFDGGDNISLESWISNFTFPCLKSVDIICDTEVCQKKRHCKLFKLLKFLLKNAVVLEKLVIIAKRSNGRRRSKNRVSTYLSQLAEKLSGCPRSSSNLTIIFHESYYND